VDQNGISNNADLDRLRQAINDGTANQPANLPRYDINRSWPLDGVNTADYLRLAQLLSGTNTTQAWSNVTIIECVACALPEGPAGGASSPEGFAGGSDNDCLTAEQNAVLIADLQAACVEYDVDPAGCQQMIDFLFPPGG
jgi:hypothetical protein